MGALQYAIIGTGMMGQEHIRNIQLLENTEIAAILEPNYEMREAARALAPNATFCKTLEETLAIETLDCLVIVTPNYMHVDQLRQIVATLSETRPIPILIEKPLATELGHGDFIREIGQRYKAPIWVAMEYRYMPPVAEFIKRADEITGGIKMLTIREHRFPFLEKVDDWNRFNKFSGGTLVEKCCHFFDLMRFILKSEPVRVMASGNQDINHLNEDYDGLVPDIWDNAYVIVDFENGARAMLELCMFAEGSRYQEEITAVGGDGKIECFVPGPGRFWPEHLGEAPVAKVVTSPRAPRGPEEIDIPVDETLLDAGDHNGSTFYQHQRFQQVVLGKGEVEVSLYDGWKAVEIGMAAQEAAKRGCILPLSQLAEVA